MAPPAAWRLALPMYNVAPVVTQAWQGLLEAVVVELQALGWRDRFDTRADTGELLAFWRAPQTLLSQTCGYPLRTELGETVHVLAAPAFDLPGCDGVLHTSVVVVPEDGALSLEALRGKVAAVNQPHSNSGMNALRHTFAPLSRSGRFFGAVRHSGGHLASMAMLQRGEADVATIDCVTYGLAALHAPEHVQRLRILQHTPALPGLPFIASRQLNHEQAAALQRILLDLPAAHADLCAPLRLVALQPARYADYAAVLRLRDEAIARGYPVVA